MREDVGGEATHTEIGKKRGKMSEESRGYCNILGQREGKRRGKDV